MSIRATSRCRRMLTCAEMDRQIIEQWRANKVFERSLDATAGGDGVDVLRGPAYGERDAGHASRRGAGVQGRLPSVQDDAGLPRRPHRRLGLPRPAGRARGGEGTRVHRQARHRGVRHRPLQRTLPRVRAATRRRICGHERTDGLLGRLRERLLDHEPRLHPVGVVGAQDDLRQRTAGRGLPGHAVLPAMRYRPVRPRARTGRRLHRGRRPRGLRPVPGDLRTGGRGSRSGRVDDDAVDARLEHRGRGEPHRRLRRRAHRGRNVRGGRATAIRCPRR